MNNIIIGVFTTEQTPIVKHITLTELRESFTANINDVIAEGKVSWVDFATELDALSTGNLRAILDMFQDGYTCMLIGNLNPDADANDENGFDAINVTFELCGATISMLIPKDEMDW